MDVEREARLADLLFEALERPVEARRAFLDAACGDDPSLVDEVLAALDAESRIGDFLERPAGELVAAELGTDAREADSRIDVGETTLGPPQRIAGSPTVTVGATDEQRTDAAGKPDWEGPLGRDHLGSYRLIGLLGAGGMGQVYLGEDPRLGRQVAVKILPPEMAARGEWLERFEREARALATLNHPGIVTIHSIEEDDGIRFLTMERVEGRTLHDAIPAGGLPVGDFLRIALELADALGAAHRRGVVHRDLKPANVMVTADRRVKILDFGIAKLEIADRPSVSKEGQVLGTVAYMAPEQLLGDPIDARTDLFSFGILLYQMATGRHPFPGSTRIQRITLILDGKCRPVAELRPDLPDAVSAVIARCMEKDPDDRYADVDALVAELTALRDALHAERFLESRTGWTPVTVPDRRASLRRGLSGLIAGLAIAVVIALAVGRRPVEVVPATEPEAEVVVERAPRTALAVLEFQNLTGDPELDWLSAGIAELLITDLAQSPGLAIESLAEVRGAVDSLDIDPTDRRPEVLRQLAETVGAEALVRGSFARVGDRWRIAYTLGEVLDDPSADSTRASGSFEGQGEASLFALVDQLGAAIFDVYGSPPPELEAEPLKLAETTTSSLKAWQAFVRANALYEKWARPEEALEALAEALRHDPGFALASVTAAKIHQSLGDTEAAQEHAERAFELADRLPLVIRFDVEGGYYGTRWSTNGRAIETYELAVKAYPDRVRWRNNLARRYAFFEKYHDALRELDIILDSDPDFWGDAQSVANARAALGDFETGYQLLAGQVAERPDHWFLRFSLVWHLTEWGRLDEAAEQLDQLSALRSNVVQEPYGRWRWAVLAEDWAQAEAQAARLLGMDGTFARWRGHVSTARNALYRGDALRAREHFEAAIDATTGADRGLMRCFLAELYLAIDAPDAALEQTTSARADGLGQWPELRSFALAALAEQALGRPAEADAHVAVLRERWRRQPNSVEERQIHWVEGLLALERGDRDAATAAIERAAALLPPRGVEFSWHVYPDHVPIWVALGEAHLAADQPAEALAWLERAMASGAEHLEQPLAYVRAFELASLAAQRQGDSRTARQHRARFESFWPSGSLTP